MSGLIRIQVDTPALVDAILAYVNDPRADRNAFHNELLSDELEHQLGLTQDVLEALLLDGASTREHVEPSSTTSSPTAFPGSLGHPERQ